MIIHENRSLKPYNTFGFDVNADKLIETVSVGEIQQLVVDGELKEKSTLILGGGSNILLTDDFNGVVLLNRIPGIELVDENEDHVWVKAGAGVIWHSFVLYCIEKGWGGIENLSLIPGSVGAAPMQNIGAYGMEIKNTFESLEAVDRSTGALHTFSNGDCEFGYRSSIFKTSHKDRYIIVSVTFKLNKHPQFNTSYGAIEQELERMHVTELSLKNISQAVINIRQQKLPDPKKIGNSGSFFKNPIISNQKVELLKQEFENIPVYPVNETESKVAAGWLIDQAGWKGKTFDTYGVHKNQALVLVNYGGATGQQVFDLSEQIIEDIKRKFGVELEREVNVVK